MTNYTYSCTYSKEFPVDKYDRPGGMYSMADLPIQTHKVLERDGIILSQDSKQKVYEIKDKEKGWTFIVPFNKVTVGEQLDPVTV
jgi:hypothetical protein